MSRRIPARIFLICLIVVAVAGRGSTSDYLGVPRARTQRHAACPSCHRDCPGALSAPWYGRAIYQQPAVRREDREVQPQSFAVGAQNYGSQCGQQIFRHPHVAPSRSGAADESPAKFASACHRENPFVPRDLRGIDPHAAPATAAPAFAVEALGLTRRNNVFGPRDLGKNLHQDTSNRGGRESIVGIGNVLNFQESKERGSRSDDLKSGFRIEGSTDDGGLGLMGDTVVNKLGNRKNVHRDTLRRGNWELSGDSRNIFGLQNLRKIDGGATSTDLTPGFMVVGATGVKPQKFPSLIGRDSVGEPLDSKNHAYRDTLSHRGQKLVDKSENPFGLLKNIYGGLTPGGSTPAFIIGGAADMEPQKFSNLIRRDSVIQPLDSRNHAYRDTSSHRGQKLVDKSENPFGLDVPKEIDRRPTPAVFTPAFFPKGATILENQRHLTANQNHDLRTLGPRSYVHLDASNVRGPKSIDKCENPFRSLREILTPASTTPAFSSEISPAFEPRRLAGLTMNRNVDLSALQGHPYTSNSGLQKSHDAQKNPIDSGAASFHIQASAPTSASPSEISLAKEHRELTIGSPVLYLDDRDVASNQRGQETFEGDLTLGSSENEESGDNETLNRNFLVVYEDEEARVVNEEDSLLADKQVQVANISGQAINPTDVRSPVFVSEEQQLLPERQPRRDRSYESWHQDNYQDPNLNLNFHKNVGDEEKLPVTQNQDRRTVDDSIVQEVELLENTNVDDVEEQQPRSYESRHQGNYQDPHLNINFQENARGDEEKFTVIQNQDRRTVDDSIVQKVELLENKNVDNIDEQQQDNHQHPHVNQNFQENPREVQEEPTAVQIQPTINDPAIQEVAPLENKYIHHVEEQQPRRDRSYESRHQDNHQDPRVNQNFQENPREVQEEPTAVQIQPTINEPAIQEVPLLENKYIHHVEVQQPRIDRSYESRHQDNHQDLRVNQNFQENPREIQEEPRAVQDQPTIGDSPVEDEELSEGGILEIEIEATSDRGESLVDNGEVVEEEKSIRERATDMEPELIEDVENPDIEATEATIVEVSSEGTTVV